MKNLWITLFIIIVNQLNAQDYFNYQAIISDSNGAVVASQSIGVQLSIIYNSTNGTVVYKEQHSPTTDSNGLINLTIGTGTQLSSADFSSINWSTPYIYLKSEIDLGSGYVDVGTDLIGQVPIAIFAKQLKGITVTSGTISATGANLSGTVTASAFVGDGSGLTNVVASGNVDSLNNVLIGNSVFTSNTTGSANVAIGLSTLSYNNTGYDNIAVGRAAMMFNGGGSKNVAIGAASLENNSSDENIGIGYKALFLNTSGNNVAVGTSALGANITGTINTATGNKTLSNNTIGSYNSGFGNEALFSNISGSNNTAVGVNALRENQTASNNTALGYNALFANTAAQNVAVGSNALSSNTTGSFNTALGYEAGDTNTSGSNNTLVGYNADVGSNNLTNATAIGANAVVATSNTIRLGAAGIAYVKSDAQYDSSSDRRLKENIVKTSYGLEEVLKLNPVNYRFISNGLNQIGFIAQEVQPLLPEVVTGTEGDIEKGETLGITYSSLIPVLTKAIQEQQQQLEAQQKLIQSLLERLETLENK